MDSERTVIDLGARRERQVDIGVEAPLIGTEFDLLANYDGCTKRRLANLASEDEDINPEASMIAHRYVAMGSNVVK